MRKMKKSWICSQCHLVFSRKWNLERHFKLIHQSGERNNILEPRLKEFETTKFNNVQQGAQSSFLRAFSEVAEFGEILNRMSTSSQISGKLNSLQSQIGSLQQELSYYKNHLNELISSNWLMPLKAVQGFSGYICNKCQNFSLKPIFNLGYDKTMESRHICNENTSKRNYYNFEFSQELKDTESWATRILFDNLSRIVPIGKCIIVKDLTRAFNNFSTIFNPDEVRTVFGIPDRYYGLSLENSQTENWMEHAINNAEEKIMLSDDEVLKFLKLSKSTYAIFQIPVKDTFKHMFMYLTGYY